MLRVENEKLWINMKACPYIRVEDIRSSQRSMDFDSQARKDPGCGCDR